MPRGVRRLPLVYSCSGCSSAAQMANYVALCLNRDRYAEMSCIAGVGGDVPSLVRVAKAARPVVAIDGCKLHCVRSCLKRHDVEPTLHVTLTEMGILKRFHAEFSEDEATRVFHHVIAALRNRGLARPETADEIERTAPNVPSSASIVHGPEGTNKQPAIKTGRGAMTIGPDTLWIDALIADEAIFDRLVAFNGKFAKFQRVLNDERVASELRIADVARILGLIAEDMLDIAAGKPPKDGQGARPAQDPSSFWFASGAREKVLDLRPVFDCGQEPLAMILDEVARLPNGTDLVVEAPFHPLPLRRLLGGRGFDSSAHQVSSEHWRVVFRRAAAA